MWLDTVYRYDGSRLPQGRCRAPPFLELFLFPNLLGNLQMHANRMNHTGMDTRYCE